MSALDLPTSSRSRGGLGRAWRGASWSQKLLGIVVLCGFAILPTILIASIVVSATRAKVPATETLRVAGENATVAVDVTSVQHLRESTQIGLGLFVGDHSEAYMVRGHVRLTHGAISKASFIDASTWTMTDRQNSRSSDWTTATIDPDEILSSVESDCPGLGDAAVDVSALTRGATVPVCNVFLIPPKDTPGLVEWNGAAGGQFYSNAGTWSAPAHPAWR